MRGIHDKRQPAPPESGDLMIPRDLRFQPKSNSSSLVLAREQSELILFQLILFLPLQI